MIRSIHNPNLNLCCDSPAAALPPLHLSSFPDLRTSNIDLRLKQFLTSPSNRTSSHWPTPTVPQLSACSTCGFQIPSKPLIHLLTMPPFTSKTAAPITNSAATRRSSRIPDLKLKQAEKEESSKLVKLQLGKASQAKIAKTKARKQPLDEVISFREKLADPVLESELGNLLKYILDHGSDEGLKTAINKIVSSSFSLARTKWLIDLLGLLHLHRSEYLDSQAQSQSYRSQGGGTGGGFQESSHHQGAQV